MNLKADDYTIYLPGKCPEKISEFAKKEILRFKNRIRRYISGYYKAYIYVNKIYGMIIDLKKEESFAFFKNFLELDIEIYDESQMFLKFDDYFLLINKSDIYFYDNKYYVSVDSLSKREFFSLSEFSEIVYGDTLTLLKEKFQKVEFVV